MQEDGYSVVGVHLSVGEIPFLRHPITTVHQNVVAGRCFFGILVGLRRRRYEIFHKNERLAGTASADHFSLERQWKNLTFCSCREFNAPSHKF